MTNGTGTGRTILVLLLILLWAGWLRLSGIDFGEGRVPARPDEDAVPFTLSAMDGGATSPSFLLYGGGYFFPLRAFVHVFDVVASGPDDQGERLPGSRVVLAARWWSALLSIATVGLVFLIARRLAGTGAGLVAAAILASCPLAVREAHFGKADTAAAFATTLLLWISVRGFADDRIRTMSVGAALAYGLSNKLSVGLLPAAAYTLLCPPGTGGGSPRPPWRRLVLGGAVTVGFFLILNPSWVKAPFASVHLMRLLLGALSDNSWLAGNEDVSGPIAYHVAISLRYGAGLLVGLLTLPALSYGLLRDRSTRLVALASLGLWAVLVTSPMVLARFFLPVLPGIIVLTAALLVTAVERLERPLGCVAMHQPLVHAGVLTLAAMIVVAEPAWSSFRITRLLGRADTRVLAGDWIAANIPDGERVLCLGAPARVVRDWGCPPLGRAQALRNVPPEAWASRKIAWVVVHRYPLAYSSVPPPPDLAGREPIAVFEPFAPGAIDAPVLEPMDAFYLPLGRLKGFVRPGPRIEIHRIGDAVPEQTSTR